MADNDLLPDGGTSNFAAGSGAVGGGDIEMRGQLVAGRDIVNITASSPLAAPAELVQLPPDIADFTGRDAVVDSLVEQLRSNEERKSPVVISAISGKAGIGKTALAIHVAHRVGRSFPDGRLYVDFRGYDPDGKQRVGPAAALAGFLRDLGVDGAYIPEDLQERARLFRTRLANKRFLVVLDNVSDETQVRDLLPGSPGCAVLITSRAYLGGLAGARHVSLHALSPDEAFDLLSEIAGRERIAAESAKAHEIAEFCGYLPLALRIIGAKLASRPEERLERLCRRLRDEHRRLDEMRFRDLEVRASFRLSFAELGSDAKWLFLLLGGLKIPSIPGWVAAALLNGAVDRGDNAINDLVDAQLLEIAGEDAAGQTRYRFHDLVRLVAQELAAQQAEGTIRSAVRRVLAGFLRLAQEADIALQPGAVKVDHGPREEWPTSTFRLADIGVDDALAWFTAELSSLVTITRRANEDELWRAARDLAATLPAFLELRAHWTEWDLILDLWETAVVNLGIGRHVAYVQRSRGDLRRDQGRFQEAIRLFDACIPVLHSEDRPGKASALRGLGNVYRQQFRWSEAYQYFAECLQIYEALGDRRGQALSEHDLGVALRNQGMWDDSITHFKRCLTVFQELADRRSEAYVLRSLAVAYRNQGQWRETVSHIEQCLPIFEAIGDRRGWAYALAPLSDVFREQGDYEQALRLLDRCLTVRRQLGDRRWQAATNRSIGVIYRLQGRTDAAASLLEECLVTFRELSEDRLAAYSLTGLGEVYGDVGRFEEALANFDLSLRTLCALPDRLWEAKTRHSRGLLLQKARDQAAAQTDLRLALEIFESLGAPEAAQVAAALTG